MSWTTRLVLIAVPLVVRHAWHFWVTRRRAPVHSHGGLVSVLVWLVCYVGLMAVLAWRLDRMPSDWGWWTAYALLWVAVGLRVWGVTHLGLNYSERIAIRPGHELIRTGPYRYLRHPLHLGLMLEIGSMAWLSAWAWSAVAVVASLILLVRRELAEEEQLEATFGDAYRAYRGQAWALIDLLPRRWRSQGRRAG